MKIFLLTIYSALVAGKFLTLVLLSVLVVVQSEEQLSKDRASTADTPE